MTHLRAFLADSPRGTAARLAEAIGSPQSTISDLARDAFWPSRDLWSRIVAATAGQVTPNDHLPAARDGETSEATTSTPAAG